MKRQSLTASAMFVLTVSLVAAAAVTGATSASATQVTSSTIRSAASTDVFAGGVYNQPQSAAALAAQSLTGADKTVAQQLAAYPTAIWLGDWFTNAQLVSTITTAVAGAQATGTTPVFVTYAIPNRDCGDYSAGGLTATQYDAWSQTIASTLAGKRAVVLIEPDSLAMLSNCPAEASTRIPLIKDQVEDLKAAGVPAYLDGGNSNWNAPATTADRLNQAGIADARGFFTNVANYYTTAQEKAYADKVSALTGGSHYVIDTSRNGRGNAGGWCNVAGAGLGAAPTVFSGQGALDAELWVKTPGASDGSCNGAPNAGVWYPAYAAALVANARTSADLTGAAVTTAATTAGIVSGTPATGTPTSAATAVATSTVPASQAAPTGWFDSATGSQNAITISGWAVDPDTTSSPVTVQVSIDGTTTTQTANTSRPDVDTAFHVGTNHGFAGTITATTGTHQVCITAVNTGPGNNTNLGCITVTVPGPSQAAPTGVLESVTGSQSAIQIQGWSVDPDTLGTPTPIQIVVDGTTTTITANTSRPDVDAAYHVGTNHGFSTTISASAGTHQVCVTAMNTGPGKNTTLGCSAATVTAPITTSKPAQSVATSAFFAATSPFNTTVASSAAVDANSASMMSALIPVTPTANLVAYGVPIYQATSATPTATVTCTESWGTCPFKGMAVPLDNSYVPGAGTDGAMVVIDSAKGIAYEFWRAAHTSSGWTTAWGSAVSLSGSGWNGVSTATGASRLGGVIMLSELQAGVIPHALVVQSNNVCANTFRSPANKTDGASTSANCIPAGSRLQIDPSVDLSAISMTPAQRAIATALQQYGAYVIDSGGAPLSVSFERAADASGSNPGAAYKALGLTSDYQALGGIPWSKVRVLAGS